MKLLNDIDAYILKENNSPVAEFLGLSRIEIHHLLYDTFGSQSPIQFHDNIDDKTLDQIPLFRLAEVFLEILHREKTIKLTPMGALPKKVVVELYDQRILLDEHIECGITKLWKEDDCAAIQSARLTAELAGLVRKANGKLALTKTGTKLLETKSRLKIFKQFFQAFADKFLWSFNDGYPEQPIGQLGWAFSVIMLEKFGDQYQTVDFYADKYFKAFPTFNTVSHQDYAAYERMLVGCYGIRTFERFLLWFGFVSMDKRKNSGDTDRFIRTDVVKSIFKIN